MEKSYSEWSVLPPPRSVFARRTVHYNALSVIDRINMSNFVKAAHSLIDDYSYQLIDGFKIRTINLFLLYEFLRLKPSVLL